MSSERFSGVNYRSIFLEPNWVLEKYYGWSTLRADSDLKVLAKSYGPLIKLLVISQMDSAQAIEQRLRETPGLPKSALLYWHDLKASGRPGSGAVVELFGRTLKKIDRKARLLNVSTFVVDLRASDEDRLAQLGVKSRNMVKRAQDLGAHLEFTQTPSEEILNQFFELYRAMAARNDLSAPSETQIRAMLLQGDLHVAVGMNASQSVESINLIYVSQEHSYYLYGVTLSHGTTGLGQLMHWETGRYLKGLGLHWYDLGGVPTTDRSDGIFQFKKSLGGQLVDLGQEYLSVPRWIAIPYESFRWVRSFVRRVR